MPVVTLRPRTYVEARMVGEYFRDGTLVLMNVTEMPDSDAKRLPRAPAKSFSS
jgi:cell division inhibitor SepF